MRRVSVFRVVMAACVTLGVAHAVVAYSPYHGEVRYHRGWTAWVRDGYMFGYPGARLWDYGHPPGPYYGGTHCWYPPHVAPWPATNGYLHTIPYPGLDGSTDTGSMIGNGTAAGGYESVPDKRGVAPNSLLLNVRVPADAVVYINGQRSGQTGTMRTFSTSDLEPGLNYTYEIRAEIPDGDKMITKTETVYATPGKMKDVTLLPKRSDRDVAKNAPTSSRGTLALHVPAESRVYVNGQLMRSTGATRMFSATLPQATSRAAEYDVRVELEQNGQTFVREETVRLAAGGKRDVTIDFGSGQVLEAKLPTRE